MKRSTAVLILPIGFTVSVIDAWFSIQSIAGTIQADDILGYVVATVMGTALTGFAVFLPILRDAFHTFSWGALWLVLTIIDVGTSILGAIWYGVMDKKFSTPIRVDQMTFEPSNWLRTGIFFAFVILVAVCCVAFGRALSSLNNKKRGQDPFH